MKARMVIALTTMMKRTIKQSDEFGNVIMMIIQNMSLSRFQLESKLTNFPIDFFFAEHDLLLDQIIQIYNMPL